MGRAPGVSPGGAVGSSCSHCKGRGVLIPDDPFSPVLVCCCRDRGTQVALPLGEAWLEGREAPPLAPPAPGRPLPGRLF